MSRKPTPRTNLGYPFHIREPETNNTLWLLEALGNCCENFSLGDFLVQPRASRSILEERFSYQSKVIENCPNYILDLSNFLLLRYAKVLLNSLFTLRRSSNSSWYSRFQTLAWVIRKKISKAEVAARSLLHPDHGTVSPPLWMLSMLGTWGNVQACGQWL